MLFGINDMSFSHLVLSLLQLWKQSFLYRVLVPLGAERYSESKSGIVGMLAAMRVGSSTPSL